MNPQDLNKIDHDNFEACYGFKAQKFFDESLLKMAVDGIDDLETKVDVIVILDTPMWKSTIKDGMPHGYKEEDAQRIAQMQKDAMEVFKPILDSESFNTLQYEPNTYGFYIKVNAKQMQEIAKSELFKGIWLDEGMRVF